MLVIDAPSVREFLPVSECIGLMREAMKDLSAGKTQQILRQILPVPGGLYGIMGGVMPGTYGSKLISVVHSDTLPSHQGVVLLFGPENGKPIALLDATSITAIRTAAASALATDSLALPDADTLAILGTGEQALMHAQAICTIRSIRQIRIWGRNPDKASGLAKRLEKELNIATRATASPGEAAKEAAIICTVTSSPDPVLTSGDVAEGAHINAVGSSRLGPREIDDRLVYRSLFFGDSRDSVLSQGAEFTHARDAGLIDDSHFLGEIGGILLGAIQGRTSPNDVTIYKSLGHIVQDLAAAKHVATVVDAAGAGQRVNL